MYKKTQTIINTKRLFLRTWSLDDVGYALDLWGNPHTGEPPESIDETLAKITPHSVGPLIPGTELTPASGSLFSEIPKITPVSGSLFSEIPKIKNFIEDQEKYGLSLWMVFEKEDDVSS